MLYIICDGNARVFPPVLGCLRDVACRERVVTNAFATCSASLDPL